jgi:hypothetical protein
MGMQNSGQATASHKHTEERTNENCVRSSVCATEGEVTNDVKGFGKERRPLDSDRLRC